VITTGSSVNVARRSLRHFARAKKIECSVCLERVLSKPTAAERKFGLMSGCDFHFVLAVYGVGGVVLIHQGWTLIVLCGPAQFVE
jgi:hypothetical protein